MYITINGNSYADIRRVCLKNGDVLFSGNLTDVEEVAGEIITFRNDGFELARDNTADYLRVIIIGNTIKLTNQPELEEESEPIETVPSLDDRVTALENEMEILTGVSE